MAALSPETIDLLDGILKARFPKVRSRVFVLGLAALSPYVRRELTDAFAEELMRSGFQKDWSPNPQGLRLEALIDLVSINDDTDD
jgi:hypothetical protein